jgi:glutathione S-transferase
MPDIRPIKIYGTEGPNPFKVYQIMAEMQLPVEPVAVAFTDVKQPEFVAVNPNGRLPAMHDPNTGVTLWETGAIIEYLTETYDAAERAFSFAPDTPEFWEARAWLFLQVSGQGPYYGQAVHFAHYHETKVPTAVTRYVAEIRRVSGVLEARLASEKAKMATNGEETDGPWIVGGKKSYVDVAMLQWQEAIPRFVHSGGFSNDDFPLVKDWLDRMMASPHYQEAKARFGF